MLLVTKVYEWFTYYNEINTHTFWKLLILIQELEKCKAGKNKASNGIRI